MERSEQSGRLDISVSQTGRTRLLRLSGEFDLAGVESFEGKLRGDESDGAMTLVVDLRGVTFMDSSGLRAILTAEHLASSEGWRFLVVRGSEAVERVMAMTDVDRRLELIDEFPKEADPA